MREKHEQQIMMLSQELNYLKDKVCYPVIGKLKVRNSATFHISTMETTKIVQYPDAASLKNLNLSQL